MAYRLAGLGDITCPPPASMNPYDESANFQLPEVCGPRDIACIQRNSDLDIKKQNQHLDYMNMLAACGARSSGGPVVQSAFTPGAQADYTALIAQSTPTAAPPVQNVIVSSPVVQKPVSPLSTMSAAVPPAKFQQSPGYDMSTLPQDDGTSTQTAATTGFDFSTIPWWAWVGVAAAGVYAMSGKR